MEMHLQEALLIELRNMNEEVSEKQKDGDTIKDLDHFRKQYAMVLVQLRDANDQVNIFGGFKSTFDFNDISQARI